MTPNNITASTTMLVMSTRLLLALLVLVQFIAVSSARGQRTRHYEATRWVMLWNVGGRMADTTFGVIREHVGSEKAIYVLDEGTLQVHALDPRSGRVIWTRGRRGSGPGELLRPVDIALTPTGLAVLDQGNGRITWLDAGGRHLRDVAGESLSSASALCVFADGSFVTQQSRRSGYLVHYRSDGRVQTKWDFPWQVNTEQPMLLSSSVLRGNPSGECHFAPTFGFGLVHASSSGRLRTTPLLEKYPSPEFQIQPGSNGVPRTLLVSGQNASLGGFSWGDTVGVQAISASGKYAGLDLYDRISGQYLATWRLPPDDRFARTGGVVYSISASEITQSVRAWADTSDTTRVFRHWGLVRNVRLNPTPPANTPARPPAPARARPPANR